MAGFSPPTAPSLVRQVLQGLRNRQLFLSEVGFIVIKTHVPKSTGKLPFCGIQLILAVDIGQARGSVGFKDILFQCAREEGVINPVKDIRLRRSLRKDCPVQGRAGITDL